MKKVFQRTFTLLKLMARGNKLVQGRLFDRLDMLLSTEGAGEELAECITEVRDKGQRKDMGRGRARVILEMRDR